MGLEVTSCGRIVGALKERSDNALTNFEVDFPTAPISLAPCSVHSVGWLTYRIVPRNCCFHHPGVYLTATAAPRCRGGSGPTAFFRFLYRAGIGGEYTASILRPGIFAGGGTADGPTLVNHGSFGVGAASSAVGAIVLRDPA